MPRRALGAGPKAPEALVTPGEALRRRKKFGEAEAALIEGLKLERGSWRGHFTPGRVYLEASEVLKAAPHAGRFRHRADGASTGGTEKTDCHSPCPLCLPRPPRV